MTASYQAEKPERGFGFLANSVRREQTFPREEVEAALERYQERGRNAVASGDWNPWADQFTEDAIYVEHHYGVLRGQAAIRAWITSTMQGQVMDLEFPVEWYLIDNDLCMIYCPNRYPSPDGKGDFQFVAATILCYAGDDRWCYEEDIYNVLEAGRVNEEYGKAKAAAQGASPG
jgi:hypothetical protein